ncbi:trkA-C domain protein [Vibrio sp. JCM 19236]|nr:trkA-C domain protein [Vibrio sp. JCM 19236]
MNLLQVSQILDEADAQVIGIIRGDTRLATRNRRRLLIANDILIIEIEPESLPKALRGLGLKLEEAVGTDNTEGEEGETEQATVENIDSEETSESQPEKETEPESGKPEDIVVQEVVVVPATSLVERTATDIDLPARYDVNLLAISRQGRRSIKRLRYTKFNEGDVLLLQGDPESIARFCSDFGCLP